MSPEVAAEVIEAVLITNRNYTVRVARLEVFRWDDVALDRVTAMVSRKVLQSAGQQFSQVYLKRGACMARHRHEWEQVLYVLQGVLSVRSWEPETALAVDRQVREGELLVVPAGAWHQAEALDDTFALVMEPVGVSGRDAGSPDVVGAEADVSPVV